MLRYGRLLCGALQSVHEGLSVTKDYRRIQADKEILAADKKREEFDSYPLRYQLLECRPGVPLAIAKLKYLIACRRTHPEVGGDAEDFLRVSLAYQDIMKDYGVETVDNQIVNLGNFQSDDHEAQNYLSARTEIKSFIPISTLEDHIRQIEEVKERLGERLSEKLASNSDEAMWLLEDIEEMMEQTGLKTVKVQTLEDGKLKVADQALLTHGTEKPFFLPFEEGGSTVKGEAAHLGAEDSSQAATESGGGEHEAECHHVSEHEARALHEAQVSFSDIEVLNAKNSVQDRRDVAGLASRTSTEVMNNTQEKKKLVQEANLLVMILSSIMVVVYMSWDRTQRVLREEAGRPGISEHISGDTMLPWWGNDVEYESQVKRIFIEEWRRARATSRRAQTFQDGVARESLDDDTKKNMDLQIFTVTAEKLRAMRENAEKHPGRG